MMLDLTSKKMACGGSIFSRTFFDVKIFNSLVNPCPKETKHFSKYNEAITNLKYQQRILKYRAVCNTHHQGTSHKNLRKENTYSDRITYIRAKIIFVFILNTLTYCRKLKMQRVLTVSSIGWIVPLFCE